MALAGQGVLVRQVWSFCKSKYCSSGPRHVDRDDGVVFRFQQHGPLQRISTIRMHPRAAEE
eukprot:1140214-Pyramimonas_sp.AAC.1